MKSINPDQTQSTFFPNSKSNASSRGGKINEASLKRNSLEREQMIDAKTQNDAKVNISDAIKDFAKIKKVVDTTPDIDNTDKIARLKSQIAKGEYNIDYDALAEKMLAEHM